MSGGTQPTRLRPWNVAAVVLLLAYAAGLVLFCAAALAGTPGPPSGAFRRGPLAAYADPRGWWPVALQLLLGLAAFGAYYLPRRYDARSFSLLLTGGLGVSTIVLGMAGVWNCTAEESPFFTPLALALGLLLGASPTFTGVCAGQPFSSALQVGRLFGPLLLVTTALGIAATIFRAQLDRLLVRFARSLVVVVGLSDEVLPLLRRLAQDRPAGTTLVVLGPEADGSLTRLARTLGARVVLTDLDDLRLLRTLVVRRGRFTVQALYVVSANASVNLAWARRFRQLADRSGGADIPPLITARLDDPWQAEYWRRTNAYRTPPATETGSRRWVSDALSVYEVTAAILVDHAQQAQVERLAVVGSSPLALAICAELAQRQREAGVLRQWSSPPSIAGLVLVGPQADGLRDQHRLRQERFGNSAHAQRIAVSAVAPTQAVLASLLAGRATTGVVLTEQPAEAALEDFSPSLLAALHPTWNVYHADGSTQGLAARPVMKGLHPFGLTIEPAPGGPVGSWERAARVVHRSYLQSLGEVDPARPAQRPWEELAPFYRESNIRLVTATLAGAESVGRAWAPEAQSWSGPASTAVEPAQLVAMAEFEHTTWRQFHLDAGWGYGEVRDDARRVHNALLPWDRLSPAYRDRAIGSVRAALTTLHALGYRSWTIDERRPWQAVTRHGEVQASVLDHDWRWQTGSGAWLQAQVGDYRVSNGSGDAWSVEPEIFLATHEHVAGDRWRRTGQVWAQPAVPGELVISLEGAETAEIGDWVMKGTAGEQWLTSAAHFGASYERAGG